jgi:hypothetical protein
MWIILEILENGVYGVPHSKDLSVTSNLGPEGCSLEETAVPAAGACPALVPRKAHGWQATVASPVPSSPLSPVAPV